MAHPLTKGVSYVLANAKPSHDEGHHRHLIHYVSHLTYGAGRRKGSWQDRRNVGN